MVFFPRANVIITGHENSDLKMWSLDCPEEVKLKTVSGQAMHENTISALVCATISSDDAGQKASADVPGSAGDLGYEMLIAGSYDRQLSFWKVTQTSDGTAVAKFERAFCVSDDFEDAILAVAYCPAANAVYTGGNAGVIRKWAFRGVRQLESEYEGHEDAVTCFAVDANFLYSGSVDCTVRIWETSRGYVLKVVRVHEVTLQALLVIPESGFVASCAFDGRVVFWDPQIARPDVKELQTYEQHEEFRAISYVDINRAILVGCESGKIISFPMPADDGAAEDSMLPKALDGVETPRTDVEDQGHETL